MSKKLRKVNEVVDLVKDGDVVMIGGFLSVGAPLEVIDALVEKGTKDLTIICNDTAFVDSGIGKLVVNKQVKRVISSHIGTSKETGRQMLAGETQVDLVPQGTLIEQIRAGGFGLGGVLTATGVGTAVEEGKQIVEVDGKKYLLEKPLRADVALVFANTVDEFGNMNFHGSTRNFNHLMPTSADLVIVETDKVVRVGDLDQDLVHTPGIFVDYVVERGQ